MQASRIFAAAIIATVALAPPAAQAMDGPAGASWSWTQTGGNFDVVWHGLEQREPHGGGAARLIGGGQDAAAMYAGTPVLAQRASAIAALSGGGADAAVTYGTGTGIGTDSALVGTTAGRPDREG
jgi:hypothetical protein